MRLSRSCDEIEHTMIETQQNVSTNTVAAASIRIMPSTLLPLPGKKDTTHWHDSSKQLDRVMQLECPREPCLSRLYFMIFTVLVDGRVFDSSSTYLPDHGNISGDIDLTISSAQLSGTAWLDYSPSTWCSCSSCHRTHTAHYMRC